MINPAFLRRPARVRSVPFLHRVLSGFLLVINVGSAEAASGIIYFNRIPTLDSPATLHRANADGSGEELIPTVLPEAYWPAVSRDGRRILVTSGDPARPFRISDNVYALNTINGGIAQVTFFNDLVRTGAGIVTNDLGQVVGDFRGSSYTINFPNRKALSPDGSQAVTINMVTTGVWDNEVPRTNSISQPSTTLATGSFRAPFVETYPVAAGVPMPIGNTIYLGDERTIHNQGGDGVDWHPQRAELVVSVRSDIPATGNAGIQLAEGTVLAVFSAGGVNPFVRKLTSPSGIWNNYGDLFAAYLYVQAQQDYAPAISPDGTRVAYLRHTQRTDTQTGLAPLPALCEIRMIEYDGTGDQSVLVLAEGLWVTQLCWAPDGSEIAFDLAPQLVLNGIRAALGDATRSQIHAVAPDGSNPRLVIAGPASFPAWAPGAVQPPLPLTLAVQLIPGPDGRMRLRVTGDPAPGPVQVQTSADLVNWSDAGVLSAGMEWIITSTQEVKFFRVAVPGR